MSYFPKTEIHLYHNECIVFDTGRETRDCYSIQSSVYCNVNENSSFKHQVIKNWHYPTVKEVSGGKKHREELFEGSLKECMNYIHNMVKEQGYWDKDPDTPFKQIFIEPII